ncbi:MAG: tetratricopeptide repeat protein [candidate division NC10 bacterium]|nr:tetratricopeptide repeat protein [candidate division NC10 bacterium]
MKVELRQLIQKATQCFLSGEYDEAERLLLEIIDQTPLYANIYNMLGFIYSQKNLPQKAIEQFRRALSLNPNYTEAQLNLAITLADIGAYDLAIMEYGKALERERGFTSPLSSVVRSKLANAHADLGKVYHELGLYEQAVEEFKKSLDLCPHFADVHNRLAISYREKGDYKEANTSFLRALEINPHYVEAYTNLGLLYFKGGDLEKAILVWEKALSLDPENNMAKIYLRLAREMKEGPA